MPVGERTRDDERFQTYVRAVLRDGDSDSILRSLSDLDVPAPYYVRMKVFYSNQRPDSILRHLVEKGDLELLSEQASVYAYKATIGRKHRMSINVPLVVFSFKDRGLPDNVQAIVSISTSNEWNALKRFLRKSYPRLVPVLLSQRELISGVHELRRTTGNSVQVRSYTVREKIDRPTSRQWKVNRAWTDEELGHVLLNIQDRNEVITSLDVVFYPRKGDALHVVPHAGCKVRKTGEIEVDRSFRVAFDAVAGVVAEAGYKKLMFLSGRGLRSAQYRPRPVAIDYAPPVFENLEMVRALVGLISNYPHSMRAVQHGNPYAHLKLTDTLDYSSFDIWAVPPSRLAILPGLRASEAAFERLIDYLFENFKEGDVVEYQHA